MVEKVGVIPFKYQLANIAIVSNFQASVSVSSKHCCALQGCHGCMLLLSCLN